MSKPSAVARTLASASLLTLAVAGSVEAAALEQVVPSTIRLLYQPGRYLEFGALYSSPDQSGNGATLPAFPPLLPVPSRKSCACSMPSRCWTSTCCV